MAAIPLPLIAAAGITGASVAIPVAVKVVTLALASKKLSHKTTAVNNTLQPAAGTHISYKYKDGIFDKFSYRHAIVAEDSVANDGQPTKLIYWFEGNVICEDVQLTFDATGSGSSPLYHNEYNYLISHELEAVAARARSLCREYVQPGRHGVIHNYWSCFNGDEHFALWCHTGVRLSIGSGILPAHYNYVRVHSISCLLLGDHIYFECSDTWTYRHGIVVNLNEPESTITVARKKKNVNLPLTVTIQGSDYFGKSSKYKLYRYDYDIALGCKSDLTVQKALNETKNETRSNGPSVFKSDVEFAVWCKLLVVISPKEASTLADARVASCLQATVLSKNDLRPGDHVEFDGQHLIVEDVTVAKSGTQLEAIFMPKVKPGTGSGQKIMQKTFENVEIAISGKKLKKYFYDNAESNIDKKDAVQRAQQHLGDEVDELPFKDSQHFAMWCRTGQRQLHHVSWKKDATLVAQPKQ